MEDSVMNGSVALDALVSSCRVGEKCDKKLMCEIADGILKCCEYSSYVC